MLQPQRLLHPRVADKHPVSTNRYKLANRKRHTLAMAARCSRLQEFFLRVRTLAVFCQIIGCPRPRKLHLLRAVVVLYYMRYRKAIYISEKIPP